MTETLKACPLCGGPDIPVVLGYIDAIRERQADDDGRIKALEERADDHYRTLVDHVARIIELEITRAWKPRAPALPRLVAIAREDDK